MDWLLACKALILGIVEGLTEFLPVSSTGHLIVAGSLLNFTDEHAKTFDVVIQLGAILAVCWEFRRRIASVVTGLPSRPEARRFTLNVIIATIPAIVLGLLLEKSIKAALFSPVPVAFALVVGGVVILWAEARQRGQGGEGKAARVHDVDDLTPMDAAESWPGPMLRAHPRHVALGVDDHRRDAVWSRPPRGDGVFVFPRDSDHVRRDGLRVVQGLASRCPSTRSASSCSVSWPRLSARFCACAGCFAILPGTISRRSRGIASASDC